MESENRNINEKAIDVEFQAGEATDVETQDDVELQDGDGIDAEFQDDVTDDTERQAPRLRNGYSAKTNKICGILLVVIGVLYIPLGVFMVSDGSVFKGTAAALVGLLLFRLGRRFVEISRKLEEEHKQ